MTENDRRRLVEEIFEGKKGPLRDVVLLNAAATLVVAGEAADIEEGLAHAAESIDSGAAAGKLQGLIRVTKG